MPPKVGAIRITVSMNSCGRSAFTSISKTSMSGEMLEQHRLAFHDGLAGQRANIAKPEHRATVGDHADQIALGGVLVGILWVGSDTADRLGHTRRIGERQITLGLRVGLDTSTLIFPGRGLAW